MYDGGSAQERPHGEWLGGNMEEIAWWIGGHEEDHTVCSFGGGRLCIPLVQPFPSPQPPPLLTFNSRSGSGHSSPDPAETQAAISASPWPGMR